MSERAASERENERFMKIEEWMWRYARGGVRGIVVKNSNKYYELILSTMLKRKKCKLK